MNALLFRAVGILRPILILLAVREISIADASLYVSVLSRYLICTEIYNLLFPTDGLYSKEASFADAVRVSARRVRASLPVSLLTVAAMASMDGVGFWEALVTGTAAFLAAIAVPYYGFAFPRLGLRKLASVEITFHLSAILGFALWLLTKDFWWLLVILLAEMPLKTAVVLAIQRISVTGTVRQMRASEKNVSLLVQLGSGVKVGFPLTLANYFFRLPFALPFASGPLDPLYMLVGQVTSAAYNLLLVVHSVKLRKLAMMLSFVAMALGAVVLGVSVIRFEGEQLWLNVLAGLCFAYPYATWLTLLSQPGGLLTKKSYRTILVLLLLGVLTAAAFVSPHLIWLAMLIPCLHHVFLRKAK